MIRSTGRARVPGQISSLPGTRPMGRSLAAMHPPRIETRASIHARAMHRAEVEAARERNFSGQLGRTSALGNNEFPVNAYGMHRYTQAQLKKYFYRRRGR